MKSRTLAPRSSTEVKEPRRSSFHVTIDSHSSVSPSYYASSDAICRPSDCLVHSLLPRRTNRVNAPLPMIPDVRPVRNQFTIAHALIEVFLGQTQHPPGLPQSPAPWTNSGCPGENSIGMDTLP